MSSTEKKQTNEVVVIVMLDSLLRGLKISAFLYIALTIWVIQIELYAMAPLFMCASIVCGLVWCILAKDR